MNRFTVTGAQVFLPDEIVETTVSVEDGLISDIGGPVQGIEIDGRNYCLAPALVDVHGDAFERQIMPRPGVFFPIEAAVLETDRQLAANGIATAFHAVTLSWEPGLRSLEKSQALIEALNLFAPRLTVENRVQLRWETFCFEAMDIINEALEGPLLPSLAFNDHTSMAVLHPDIPLQDRPFDHVPDYPVADMRSAKFSDKMKKRGERSGLSGTEYASLIRERWTIRPDVPEAIRAVAAKARSKNVAMLSHDDTQKETRDYYRSLGADISEFPMTIELAKTARGDGDMIVFGAPNAVRGGSHIEGSPGAGEMVEDGLCDILASDYYYPAMLAGVARLDAEKRADRLSLWRLISSNPARAMKLVDRGDIVVGNRADLVLVCWPDGHMPAIRRTWVAGRDAYISTPAH
ncbi:alpha-D-ribose 1-methylphosphonate 5-triphosphate diphosphatase [uncultured Cohaesibacter sp.]|uniref:alpha-D-ribose 1-methylphosphonate 5-triphosphate diphosphatase n=1 Tax=uncultured Cohaesibacter sp. TaxID=1002546 RepID=UPI002930BD5C|nr:alpha-D-ribose 1-methylphosphonate 5-triphosphate diphosphatase [uncultured Cohaesibacter sp.]